MLFDGIKLIDSSAVVNLKIDSGTVLPTGEKGELFLVDGQGLYAHDGISWVRTGQSAADCITGNFPGDLAAVVGSVRHYPRSPIIITKIVAWLSATTTTGVQAAVRKNGVVVETIAISANQMSAEKAVNVAVSTTDYLTLDIVSGTGKDLTIRMDY